MSLPNDTGPATVLFFHSVEEFDGHRLAQASLRTCGLRPEDVYVPPQLAWLEERGRVLYRAFFDVVTGDSWFWESMLQRLDFVNEDGHRRQRVWFVAPVGTDQHVTTRAGYAEPLPTPIEPGVADSPLWWFSGCLLADNPAIASVRNGFLVTPPPALPSVAVPFMAEAPVLAQIVDTPDFRLSCALREREARTFGLRHPMPTAGESTRHPPNWAGVLCQGYDQWPCCWTLKDTNALRGYLLCSPSVLPDVRSPFVIRRALPTVLGVEGSEIALAKGRFVKVGICGQRRYGAHSE